ADLLLELAAGAELRARPRRRVHCPQGRGGHDQRAGRWCAVPVGAGAAMTCDFSLTHYRDLLLAARAGGYRWAGFDTPPEPGIVILRHDVDLSLDGALALAEVEAAEDT